MAASKEHVVQWTVLVVVEVDESLTGTYRRSSNTKLSEMMHVWKEDFEVFGDWVFKSGDGGMTYHDDWTTLEVVGETTPGARIVTLRAELVDGMTPKPISEIFVHLEDRCHQLFVKSNEKLGEVLWQLQRGPKYLKYNGLMLNHRHTIKQAGLQNNAVTRIYKSQCSVNVKLSTGYTRIFEMSSEDLVLHLREKVNLYESDDFSLRYLGRYLKSTENVSQIKEVVEVATEEFVVHVNDRRINWKTKAEPIAVSEFLSQLAINGNIDSQELEAMAFVCVGCQRHILNSKDYVQRLPVECCREKSLTLNTLTFSNIRTNNERNDIVKHIQGFHDHLLRCRENDSITEGLRSVSRDLKKSFTEDGLEYNNIGKCIEKLLRGLNELKGKIKKLEANNEILNANSVESEKYVKTLRTTNMRAIKQIKILKEKNKKMNEEKMKLHEELGVKLLVIYHSTRFSFASQRHVQQQGQWPWNASLSYIKCQIPGMLAGHISFEDLRHILQRLLTKGEIREIDQCRGSVAGKEVAWVTSRNEDQATPADESSYCDADGAHYSWQEAGNPLGQDIRAGGHVLICGGRRRTVLGIS